MAISATFIADFTQFQQAVDRAELKLTGLRSESGRVERQLQRMGDSFSGKKIFADAELATKAVEGLGGVSKLTAGEQSRLNGIVTEAISKYKAMGLEAPKHLTAVADATKPINSGFSSILSTLKSIGPALGLTFSVGAITGFARSVGQFAGEMLDLEAQTGITTDRLQAFNFAGAGVGLTIDKITTNADQLARRLGGDDKSVNEALAKVNLSANELKQLDLDEVMFRIDESLVGVNNKFERARILTDLFGRSGAEMGRLMDGNLRKVIKAAEDTGAVIDRELLKKADAFDDAWAQAWIKFRAYAVEAIGFVGGLITGLIDQIAKLQSRLPSGLGGFGTGGGLLPRGLGGFTERSGGNSLDIALPEIARLRAPRTITVDSIAADIVKGSGIGNLLDSTDRLTSAVTTSADAQQTWAAKTREAADATASWARNLQGEFLRAQDLAFLTSPTSAATKALQKLMMGAGVGNLPGALQASSINPALLMFGPGGLTQSGSAGLGLAATGGGGFLNSLTGGFSNLLKGFTGGAGVGGFLKNLGGSLVGGIGNALGGALTGGISSLLGLATTGISKLLGGLLKTEGKQTNRTRDAAISEFTGISGDKLASQDAFRKMATEAGIASSAVDRLFSTGKIKNFQSEFERMANQIKAFTTDQEADQQRLNAALEKYGLTIEHLGDQEQQKRLDAQAKELIEDWRVLIDAGVEITDVNNAMADTINEYLQTAIKLGQEIPNAFRPILEKMLEQGTLTDEAGNAITDLEKAGIHFSETMTEGFDKVVKKLDELIEKIGLANVHLGELSVPEVPDSLLASRTYSDSDLTPVPMASGGRGRVTRPTLFLAGESGPEDVAFSGANRSFSGSSPEVVAAIESLDSRIAAFMRVMPIALRDAVLLAR